MGWQDAPLVGAAPGGRPAWESAPEVDAEPSLLRRAGQTAGNIAAGAVRGAGSIGATLLYPWDAAQDLYHGDREKNLSGLITGQQPISRNEERRQAMDGGLQALGAQPDSFAYSAGKLGAEIAGTAGVGGVLAKGAQFAGATAPVVQGLASGGLNVAGAGGVGGAALRALTGATTGGAAAGLVDPQEMTTGAAIGAVVPGVAKAAGAVGNAISNAVRGPAIPDGLQAAARAGIDAGYVIPPSQVRPTLLNRVIEGTAGKQTTAQNASARNQLVTNNLARKALGLADDVELTPEVLDAFRAKAGESYGAISQLGPMNAAGAKLPADVGVQRFTDTLTMAPRAEVDAGELVRAWKQANHDATGYYRAYARDANPETLAKAKGAASAASQIDDFLASRLQQMGRGDMLQALKDARVRIAKSYSVESALNGATGNVAAPQLASQLKKGKPLSGDLRQAAEFAGAFPKASQPVERMGSLPQTSPLDWFSAGGAAAVTGNPLMLGSVLARPAMRAAALSGPVQSRLVPQAANSQPGQLSEFLSSPEAQEAIRLLFVRGAPVLGAQ